MTDAPELLLAHHVKTLGLPTFLREHDKQARIWAAEDVDHVRYMADLAELELVDWERRMVERRVVSIRYDSVRYARHDTWVCYDPRKVTLVVQADHFAISVRPSGK